MDILLIAFLCYVLGAVFRTLYDFLWKAVEHQEFSWDHKYTASLLISIILSFISAMVSFSTVHIPSDGYVYVAMASVTMGFTIAHIVNKPIDHMSKKAT